MTTPGGEDDAGEEVPLDQAPEAVRSAPEEGDEQAGRSGGQQQAPQEEEVVDTQELEIVGRHTGPIPIPSTARSWHPDDPILWDIYTQTRPDGTVAVICAHCGELRPCDELIRRHMATDLHRLCVDVGRCYYAGRAIHELPPP